MDNETLNMTAEDKQDELDKLIAKADLSLTHVDKRLYRDDEDNYVKFHDVCTREKTDKKDEFGFFIYKNRMHGFKKVRIPNPIDSYEHQLETLVELYGDKTLVGACLNSLAITGQQGARKIVKGGTKLTQSEFDVRFDKLDSETLGRLKTMEYIRQHITETWEAEIELGQSGELRLF